MYWRENDAKILPWERITVVDISFTQWSFISILTNTCKAITTVHTSPSIVTGGGIAGFYRG